MIISPQQVIISPPNCNKRFQLTLEGLKKTQKVRLEHEICRNMCWTPVQAISIHKILTRFTGGCHGRSKSVHEMASEPSKGPRMDQGPPKWTPNGWSLQLPLIDLSPFPGPLTLLGGSGELELN